MSPPGIGGGKKVKIFEEGCEISWKVQQVENLIISK